MNNSRLYINNGEIPILRDVSIPTTYKIADIKDPFQRDSDTTLSIEIPSTVEIDEVFEFCFEVNISLQNFNPNLKTTASFFINNTEVISNGSLQLNRIIIKPLTNEVIYICNIKGQLSDLYYSIGEKYLIENDNPAHDLDFSDYDHALTKTKYLNTWDPAVSPNTNEVSGVDTAVVDGEGYRYPLIDYGLNSGNVGDFYVHHQRPMLFLREYLFKIFELAGKTWTSTFLDGAFFKTLGVPCTEILESTDSEIADRECYVGNTASLTIANHALTYTTGDWNPTSSYYDDVLFPDDTTGVYSDAGNIYNTADGNITVAASNQYVVNCSLNLNLTVNYPTDPFDFYVDTFDAAVLVNLYKQDSISAPFYVIASSSSTYSVVGSSGQGLGSMLTQPFTLTYEGQCEAGDKFKIGVYTIPSAIVLRKISDNSLITTGTASYDVSSGVYAPGDPILIRAAFSITQINNNILEGDTVEVNRIVPRKIKQKDLFKSTINAFNLYVLPDKTNPNNYFIEPRNTFYSTNFVDWTDKLDAGKGIEIIPMGELDVKQFKYKYKQGGDYYNKAYQDAWQETYGELTFEAENEFVNGDKTNELIFSPTPLIGNTLNDLIIPKIYSNNGSEITPIKDNIRLIQWAGAISNTLQWRLFTIAGYDSTWYFFPYAGHLDNPYTPTFDLSFAVPNYVFFDITSYPTTNLFTEYHYDFIYEITNKNSKIVIAYFNLDEIDIQSFDFRKQVFVNGSYYVVNKIEDFDILDPKTTKVELFKIA